MPDDPNEGGTGTETIDDTTDIADLRKAANRSGKLSKENADLRKEIAFRDAKIDLTTPMAGFFKDNYAGELDVATIEAEARKMGLTFLGESTTTTTSTTTSAGDGVELVEGETSSTDERAALQSGATQDDGRTITPHPHEAALKSVQQAYESGATEEDALAMGVDVIMRAAAGGDKRATWNPGS